MNTDCKLLISHKPVSWFLIATILLVTLLPAHYHLHHLYNDETLSSAATTHKHVIDLHVLTEKTGQLHHDDEVTIFAASPDGIMKKSGPDYSPFILLAIVLLLLPALITRKSLLLSYKSTNLKQPLPHFTPLLRAPPPY